MYRTFDQTTRMNLKPYLLQLPEEGANPGILQDVKKL